MGWEGANVIFDTWIHPLVMGLEEHLLHMFRDDFEFHDAAGPSHHGGHAPKAVAADPTPQPVDADADADADVPAAPLPTGGEVVWLPSAENELKKIPFFVRGKARRNTEKYAAEKGVAEISVETLYEAKAHYAR
jgi:light-independent protochlorophyllide reductase subunit B